MAPGTGSHSTKDVRAFFARSSWLDQIVLRPLSHITLNWECRWDTENGRYMPESDSFADDLNKVIELVASCPRPFKYHDHEDLVVENLIREKKWPLQKKRGRWVGADYHFILEQGGFADLTQQNLIAAAAGRVHAALDYGQSHFDEMEDGHLYMLAALLSIIIYHRYCDGSSLMVEAPTDGAS